MLLNISFLVTTTLRNSCSSIVRVYATLIILEMQQMFFNLYVLRNGPQYPGYQLFANPER